MCGRFRLSTGKRIQLGLPLEEGLFDWTDKPRFNIAPSQVVPIVRTTKNGTFELITAKWGFVPSWTKGKPKLAPINAKSETVATSAMFRQAFQHRRCLVPADGFYEWQGAKPPKQPYFIHMKDDGLFCFAGLWERWHETESAEPLDTFTILTTEPNSLLKPIHNRMPVIVHQHDYDRWLTGQAPKDLLKPFESEPMQAYKIGMKINIPKNDSPDVIDRVE